MREGSWVGNAGALPGGGRGPSGSFRVLLSLPCELWLGLLSRVRQQGRVQRLQELLSDVQSASRHVKTNSGGTLLTVSATFRGGSWSRRGDVGL